MIESIQPIPIDAVTRNCDIWTKLAALDQGLNEVLTVPLSPKERLARRVVMLRRTYGLTYPMKIIFNGEIERSIMDHHARVGTTVVHLTANEQSPLYLLTGNAGPTLTSEEITTAIWTIDDPAETNEAELLVVSLYDKIQNEGTESRFIAMFPGVGFRFLPRVEELVSAF